MFTSMTQPSGRISFMKHVSTVFKRKHFLKFHIILVNNMQRRLADKLRKQEKRRIESTNEKALRISKQKAINTNRIARETETDRLARLEKQKQIQHDRIDNESEADRLARLERQKQIQHDRIDKESESDRLARLERQKQIQHDRIDNESEADRLARLERQKQIQHDRIDNESEADRLARLERQRQIQHDRIDNESEADRLARLERLKQHQHERIDKESEADRLARLERQKHIQRERIDNESEADRVARLERLKQLQHERLENESNADRLTRLECERNEKQKRRLTLQNQTAPQKSLDESMRNDDYQQTTLSDDVPTISCYVETDEPLRSAFSHLMKTMTVPNESNAAEVMNYPLLNHYHQANVCVICDRFITGTSDIKWITKHTLLQHEKRLQDPELTEPIKQCYQVLDVELKHLLLSPRARSNTEDNYTCCWQCFRSLRNDRKQKCPPKFAISNKWAIGVLPSHINDLITEITEALLSTVRPFTYVLSYSGGSHKCITGSCLFYNQETIKNVATLNEHMKITNDSNVYVLMTGKFTANQKEIIRKRCLVDIDQINMVYNWLRENNYRFAKMPQLSDCPTPIFFEDDIGHSEPSQDDTIEKHIEFQYYFPSNGEPTTNTGSFRSEEEFLRQYLLGKQPTLIFGSEKYAKDYELSLPDVFPLHFPYGFGGVRDRTRQAKVSDIECLRHYLRLSLPQFQKADIILVIAHMVFRLLSFQTASIRCSARFGTDEERLGGRFSMVTDKDILKYSAADSLSNLNSMSHVGDTAKHLLHTIRACCKSVPYSNEATLEARSKFFGLWYQFGPPSIFFTVSPGDECSFRVQLYSNPEKQLLPTPNMNHNDCIGDYLLRQKDRLDSPGACAREFHSLLQIIMECLIGWDMKQGKQTKRGIFGNVLAWGDGAEEQGRKSLHSHMIVFIEHFDRLVTMLWSEDPNIKQCAKKEILCYFEKIMSSSYDIYPQSFVHQSRSGPPCKVDNINEVCTEIETSTTLNQKQVTQCKGTLVELPKQVYRDMRHRSHGKQFKGMVARCTTCQNVFTTRDMVWNALAAWHDAARKEYPNFFKSDISFPLSNEEIHIFALRFSYDMYSLLHGNSALKQFIMAIAKMRFNEHDWKHRESCFNKGMECRYNFPKVPCGMFDVVFADDKDEATWYTVYGAGKNIKARAFSIEPKRHLCDVFMNTHNPTVSSLLGFNNNITSGNRDAMYYITMYSTKKTQEEDTFPFRKECNAIAKRIRVIQARTASLAQSSNAIDETTIVENEPDYGTGLGHVLSGITAHLWTSIISAPMAWYLVENESRFRFSHDFVTILLSQMEGWLAGDKIQLKYRRNIKTNSGWLDCMLFNYLFRPSAEIYEQFENMSLWQYVSQYQLVIKSRIKKHQNVNTDDCSDNEADDEGTSPGATYYDFDENHPGFHHAKLTKLKKPKVPILYYQNGLPDIEKCRISDSTATPDVAHARNQYATVMLLLFSSYRYRDDFPKFEDRWDFFCHKVDNNSLYPDDAKRIMQNIQNVHNSTKLSTPKDQIHLETFLRDTETRKKSHYDDDDDSSSIESNNDEVKKARRLEREESQRMLDFALEQYATKHFSALEFDGNLRVCTNPNIAVNENHLIAMPDFVDKYSILIQKNEKIATMTTNTQKTTMKLTKCLPNTPTVVRVILEATKPLKSQPIPTIQDFEKLLLSPDSLDIAGSMDACIRAYTLDAKQAAAFNIICSSFMLTYLNEAKKVPDLDYSTAIEMLQKRGARDQLFMFLGGPGGGGKSHVISAIKAMCRYFSMSCKLPFNSKVLAITASTNTAAAQLGGSTIHMAAQLRRRKISARSDECDITIDTKVVIIDEISMLNFLDFGNGDKNCRKIFGRKAEPLVRKIFGGVHVITIGDFFQLNPVKQKRPLYAQEVNAIWRDINDVIFLNGDWRYRNDPEWGELLGRLRLGLSTKQDFEKINSRVVGDNLKLPSLQELDGKNISYACSTNQQRNIYADKCFLKILQSFHPKKDDISCDPPPFTIIIKGIFSESKSGLKKSNHFHNLMYNTCGDDDVETTGQYKKKVDPCLKLYLGCDLMVSDGHDQSMGYVKGTTARFVGIVLKEGCSLKEQIWEGYRVNTVDSTDVDYIVCEKEHPSSLDKSKQFNLYPQQFNVEIKMKLNGNRPVKLTGTSLIQFPVNIDIATTVHKLQGMTKDCLVIADFNYKEPNWIYVVLSRLKSIKGLFLLKPLDITKGIGPTDELIRETIRMEKLEFDTLSRLQKSGYYPAHIDLRENTVHKKIEEASKSSEVKRNNSQIPDLTNITALSNTRRQDHSYNSKEKRDSIDHLNNKRARRIDPIFSIDNWFNERKMKRLTGNAFRYNVGNCLYDSLAYLMSGWTDRGKELRRHTIDWAKNQLLQKTPWAVTTAEHFLATIDDMDKYGTKTLLEYLHHIQDVTVYATSLDLSMVSSCLKINIVIYGLQSDSVGSHTVQSQQLFCHENIMTHVKLWYDSASEHYEPVIDLP